MAKKIILLITFINLFYGIYAMDFLDKNFDFSFDIGNFGYGMDFSGDETYHEFSISMANIFVEHYKTNIGFMISPFKFIGNILIDGYYDFDYLYFLNAGFYWNPLDSRNIIFGPFVSINYLSIENWSGFNNKRYIFNTGLQLIWRTHIKDGRFPLRILGSEVGYRNISGRDSFYFTINLDLSILALFWLTVIKGEAHDIIKENEEYERHRTGPFIPRDP